MFSACCCCYESCDFDNVILCCMGSSQCLCFTGEHCLAMGVEPFGVGMVTDSTKKEICKIGLYCCTCGLKTPEVCISSAEQFLCIKSAASLPCDKDYVPGFVCAMYCLQCAPEFGCAKPPPACPALERLTANATPATAAMQR